MKGLVVGAVALGALLRVDAACGGTDDAAGKMIWGELTHLGLNLWGDLERDKCPFPWMESAEAAEGVRTEYTSADHVRFDETFWREVSVPAFRKGGVNLILIDLAEGVVYPSHPELAVKGSWSPEKLKAELKRLRGLGFEVVPKLNFSTSHDIWLKDYHRMVSTPIYYQVCRDIIRDTIEMFDRPRFVHLGLDEEVALFQSLHSIATVRQGDLWWHDVRFLIDEVEKHGSRAWVWSDYVRRHPIEEFEKRMPKSVVQSPWTYSYTHFQQSDAGVDPSEANNMSVMVKLAKAGYDVIPCGSNCYGRKTNLEDLVRFFKGRPESERKHVIGFLHAPWIMTDRCFERRTREIGEQVANCIALWNGTDAQLPWKGRCGKDGPEMFELDFTQADFEARLAALPKKGAWIAVDCPDARAVEAARKIAAAGRLHQAVLVTGESAWNGARAAVSGLLVGRREEVRTDDELRAATFADCRLVRLAADAKLSKDAVNHFRGWRGLTVGTSAAADFMRQ